MWKLKKKLCPRGNDPPMAKNDQEGNLVTSTSGLKKLYTENYQHRLRQRKIKPDLLDIYNLKTELWELRQAEQNAKKSNPWEEKELDVVLKDLRNNKTKDPNGMINEIIIICVFHANNMHKLNPGKTSCRVSNDGEDQQYRHRAPGP